MDKHKGISIKRDDGEEVAYRVFVQWHKRRRDTTVRFRPNGLRLPKGTYTSSRSKADALQVALATRAVFERELRKPRSERQITTAGDGLQHLRRDRLIVVNLGHRKQRSIGYKKIGFQAAMEKAMQIRREAGFP